MPSDASLSSWSRLLSVSLLVLAAYLALALLTQALEISSGVAPPLWPAAGLAFAVAYVWGWRILPAVAVAALGAALIGATPVDDSWVGESGASVTLALALAAGAALQAQVGATLVTRAVGGHARLTHAREIITFLFLAGPLSALIGATVATVGQVATGAIPIEVWAAQFVMWWARDALGVVVFGPLVLMLLPGQREAWQGRRVEIAVPMLLGSLIFGAFFVQAEIQADRMREQRLQQVADEAAGIVERALARDREVLEGVARFVESLEQVDADDFRFYVQEALDRYPSLQAVSWDPIISRAERASFEQAQRQQGLTGYRVTERADDGTLIPARAREEYVPVGYIEPLADNVPALGFDVTSDEARGAAVERVRDTGDSAATPPINLVQEIDGQKGMLAFVPIFQRMRDASGGSVPSEQVTGFAVGVYRFGALLSDAFSDPVWAGTSLALLDVTDADDPEQVAQRDAPRPPRVDGVDGSEVTTTSRALESYGRMWQVQVTPTSGQLADPELFRLAGLEVVGLLILGLLQSFVLVVTGVARRASYRAENLNREASTDPLTGVGNRREFLRTLEKVRVREDAEPSVLMYLDLDRFKAVNDLGGHSAGDAMLRSVTDTLCSHVRSRDLVARIGGDEFAIILNNCGVDRGRRIADVLAADVRALRVPTQKGPLGVGISIGIIAIQPGDPRGVDELIRLADDACYAAKHEGGGVRLAQDQSTERGR